MLVVSLKLLHDVPGIHETYLKISAFIMSGLNVLKIFSSINILLLNIFPIFQREVIPVFIKREWPLYFCNKTAPKKHHRT